LWLHWRPASQAHTCQAKLAQQMYDSGEFTVAQIAEEFGVNRPTIYRHLDPDTTGKKAVEKTV
jgi:hypothetical protein